MKNYIVYFEMFGKKVKTTILAKSTTEAKQNVINKIKFHKITENPEDEFNKGVDIFNKFNDILNGVIKK